MDNVQTSGIPLLEFHTGNKIPQIGLGIWKMNGPDLTHAVKVAIEQGYRRIDTEKTNELEAIAEALKELYASKKITREELFITSKIGPSSQGFLATIAACNSILKRLETSYLDLLIVECPGIPGLSFSSFSMTNDQRVETWQALETLKQEGKIKDIGVYEFLIDHLEYLSTHSEIKPVLNQVEIPSYSLTKEFIEYCAKNNIIIEVSSIHETDEEILPKDKYLEHLSKKYKKTIAQIALRWALQNNFVVFPKCANEKLISDNIQLFDFELKEDDFKKIFALKESRYTWDPSTIKY